MSKYNFIGDPVHVVRDAGYDKLKSISQEFRQKSRERMNNPNLPSGDSVLKEIFAEVGIIFNPDAMTYIHIKDYM